MPRPRGRGRLPDRGPTRAPSAARLSRLLARIDAIEATRAEPGGWRAQLRVGLGNLRDRLQGTPTPARWALVAQGALVVLLVAANLWQMALSSGPAYHTLASGGGQPGRAQAQIRVIFGEETAEREIRALLEGVGGRIVDGPSTMGAYTVQVPVPAAAEDRLALVLDRLRAHPQVRLAEPVRSR